MRQVEVLKTITPVIQRFNAVKKLFEDSSYTSKQEFPTPSALAIAEVAEPLVTVVCTGAFHQWMQESDGEETWLVAIIEKSDGSIITPNATDIIFLEKVNATV